MDGNGQIFYIYGHPLPNYLSSDFDNSNMIYPFSAHDQTTLFDVTGLGENHEIPVVVFNTSDLYISSSVYITYNWYRKRDSKLVFQLNRTVSYPGYDFSGFASCAWIGWLSDDPSDFTNVPTYPQYKEIQENGDYYCTVTTSGGYSFSGTVYFNIKGMPAKTVLENATSSSYDWTVRLSNYFDSSNYIRVGLCTQPFSNGQSTTPSGILTTVNAPSSSSGGCAVEGTITGLNGGTTYSAYGFAQSANGLYYNTGFAQITTKQAIPAAPSAPTLLYRSDGALTIQWNNVTGANSYIVGWSGDAGSGKSYSEISTTVNTLTFNNLKYGHAYYFQVKSYNNSGFSSFSATSTIYTAPKTPTITNPATSATAIDINVDITEGNYTHIRIYRHSTSSVSDTIYTDYKDVFDGQTATWSGLAGGSTWHFKAKTWDNYSGLWSVNHSNLLTVSTSNPRPTNWKWSSPLPVDASGRIIAGNDHIFPAAQWNSFTAKINLFREYKAMTTVTFTSVSAGLTCYASYIQEALNAIVGIPGKSVSIKYSSVISGDYVLADIFNNMMDSLNSIA